MRIMMADYRLMLHCYVGALGSCRFSLQAFSLETSIYTHQRHLLVIFTIRMCPIEGATFYLKADDTGGEVSFASEHRTP